MDPAARARLDRWMQSLSTNAERLLDVSAHDLVVPGDPVELATTLAGGKPIAVATGPQWRDLQRAVRDARAEGDHVLWLVLGTLTWSDRKLQSHTSPLVLWPVVLDGTRLVAAFDRSPRINGALVERLRADHGIAIDHGNASDVVVANILDDAAAFAAERPEWTVGRCAWLGAYSLAASEICHDITTRSDEVSAPLAWLLGLERPPALPDLAPGSSMYVPFDADASQLAAIRAAAGGGSFVLQGAPGTGKSYTIANLAAYCASQGRSILVVSDRAAALRDIAGKLGDVGLGEACAFAGEALPHPTARPRSLTGPTATQAQPSPWSSTTAPATAPPTPSW